MAHTNNDKYLGTEGVHDIALGVAFILRLEGAL